jgi:TetR/AcrR family transcriptional regulator
VRRGARDSRQAILDAAGAEFAARGFAGAGVDRIARRAGVNKAMIYYHFKGKAHLYHEIVRDMFTAVRSRTGAVAASPLSPPDKIDGFVEAVVAEARLRPHLPPIMMREAAEGGRHLDPDILRLMLGIFTNLRAILAEGETAHAFKPVDPVLMHFTLVGPIVMYLASAPFRNAIGQLRSTRLARGEVAARSRHLTAHGDVEALSEHVKVAARRLLRTAPGSRPRTPRPPTTSRRQPAERSGEQA